MNGIIRCVMIVSLLTLTLRAEEPTEQQDGKKPGEGKRRWGEAGNLVERLVKNPQMARRLDLTEEQRVALEKVSVEIGAKQKGLQEQMKESVFDQAELMTAETVDEATVMAAVDKTFELRKEMAKLQMKSLFEARKILTPEQIARLKNMRAEFKEKRGQFRNVNRKNQEATGEEAPE